MADIIQLFRNCKTDAEKQKFIVSAYELVVTLQNENVILKEKVTHLEDLLAFQNEPIRIIVTPEEGLIDRQIEILQERGLENELTLEETKKLDLLIKNKKIIKETKVPTLDGTPKPKKGSLTVRELALIAASQKDNDG